MSRVVSAGKIIVIFNFYYLYFCLFSAYPAIFVNSIFTSSSGSDLDMSILWPFGSEDGTAPAGMSGSTLSLAGPSSEAGPSSATHSTRDSAPSARDPRATKRLSPAKPKAPVKQSSIKDISPSKPSTSKKSPSKKSSSEVLPQLVSRFFVIAFVLL